MNATLPRSVSGASNPLTLSASRVAWFTVALLWVCAAYFLAQMSSAERRTEAVL